MRRLKSFRDENTRGQCNEWWEDFPPSRACISVRPRWQDHFHNTKTKNKHMNYAYENCNHNPKFLNMV
jgi:hypothetical protein